MDNLGLGKGRGEQGRGVAREGGGHEGRNGVEDLAGPGMLGRPEDVLPHLRHKWKRGWGWGCRLAVTEDEENLCALFNGTENVND